MTVDELLSAVDAEGIAEVEARILVRIGDTHYEVEECRLAPDGAGTQALVLECYRKRGE